jgi:hypothetical protein
MKKSEYAYTKSSIQDLYENQKIDVCANSKEEFEVTPVQQFVANFIHPRTPYYSMLLYHGVGVGKTCAAITAAEAFLDMYPRKKVFIVCPKNIRPNFEKTIFDISKVKINTMGNQNESVQCTGTTYLELSGTMEERDTTIIEKRVRLLVQKRYQFMGYSQFANFIKKTTDKIAVTEDPVLRMERQIKELQRIFNDNFLIIDEALSTGDAKFKEKSLNRVKELRGEDRALILVSHAMQTLRDTCNDVAWLHKGKLVQRGEPTEVINAYQEFLHLGKSAVIDEDF